MATAARAIDNIIRLDANPQVVAFAFTQGATCAKPGMDGRPRVMFTTTDGRRLFTSDEEASEIEHELQELGIRKGDAVVISKIGRGDSAVIRVERAGQASRIPAASAIATPMTPAPAAASVQPAANPPATRERAQVNRLVDDVANMIDAMGAAMIYTRTAGITLTEESVRNLVITAYIQQQKGGR